MKTVETIKRDIEKIVSKYKAYQLSDYEMDYLTADITTYIFTKLLKS